MITYPRIVALTSAAPPWRHTRESLLAFVRERMLGAGWGERAESRDQARQIERMFLASKVATRQVCVDLDAYYARPRSTGERMRTYAGAASALGRETLETLFAQAPGYNAERVTDFMLVSCTGYTSPGLDITLSRELGVRPDARRVVIGHMGCFGAMVGLRQVAATLRAYPDSVAALLSVELSSLHFASHLDRDAHALLALFGDGAAGALLACDDRATGPQVVDSYCVADFAALNQMTWEIGDQGFIMGLSPRVPVTLRRSVQPALERLLAPHGLAIHDITHWLIHPGGPSILEAIQARLELRDGQLTHSWNVLRDRGNCSSATVLMVLEQAMASGDTRPGDWGVMMAFGPGLTLETCLLRF